MAEPVDLDALLAEADGTVGIILDSIDNKMRQDIVTGWVLDAAAALRAARLQVAEARQEAVIDLARKVLEGADEAVWDTLRPVDELAVEYVRAIEREAEELEERAAAAEGQVAVLRTELEATQEALRKYGWHAPGCTFDRGNARGRVSKACTCGWSHGGAALAGVRQPPEPQPDA